MPLSDAVLRAKNAGALGSSPLACMVLPRAACLASYTVLRFTYVSEAWCFRGVLCLRGGDGDENEGGLAMLEGK